MDVLTMLDTDRYPVDRLDEPAGRALIGEIQTDLANSGAASLPGFLRPAALEMMVAEAEALAVLAYPGPTEASPYFFNYDFHPEDGATLHGYKKECPEPPLTCPLPHLPSALLQHQFFD